MNDNYVNLGWKEETVSISTTIDSFEYNANANPIKEIISLLKVLPLSNESQGQNTRKLKSAIAKLGLERFRYSCYTNRISDCVDNRKAENPHHYFTKREWLYDLIWFEDDEEPGKEYYIKSFPLALESEWQWYRNKAKIKGVPYAAVKYDLQKLFVCNAKVKVMIFKESSKYGIENMDNYISDNLRMYKPKANGKFLCIAYKGDMKSFIHKTFNA